MLKILFGLLLGGALLAQPQHATCTTATKECGEQIVLATYNEFPVLANDGMNTAAMEELLRRMIWHMQLNGLQAGRQRNPSGLISKDKLSAFLDGAWRAYDVLSDRDTPGAFRVGFDEVTPASYVPDTGVADEGGSEPPPDPTEPVDLGPLWDAIERLHSSVAGLAGRVFTLEQRTDLHEFRLDTLEARPVVIGCRAAIFGIPVSCSLVTQ